MTTVSIIQPAFAPWLGYFDLMARADIHVFYDDVQYVNKGWGNRNRILGPKGPEWITVPVQHTGKPQRFMDVEIAHNQLKWRERITGLLANRYHKAHHLDQLMGFSGYLHQNFNTISDVSINTTLWLAKALGFDRYRACLRSSDMDIDPDLDTTARPLAICRKLKATQFIVGPTAKAYLDESAFNMAGIQVQWHEYQPRPYKQLHDPADGFVPRLSALDYLLNMGPGRSWLA